MERGERGLAGIIGLRMKKPDAFLGDADIRPALRTRLRAAHLRDVDTVVLEELGFCRGQVRVDLAVVNGILHGYEIKSDRDSLRRLTGQVDLYGRVLDRATLVVGHRHLDEAMDLVPEWWEVLLIRPTAKGVQFKTVRRGRKNSGRDPRALVELLWLDHAIALLDQHDAARECGVSRVASCGIVSASVSTSTRSRLRCVRTSRPGQRFQSQYCSRDVVDGAEAPPSFCGTEARRVAGRGLYPSTTHGNSGSGKCGSSGDHTRAALPRPETARWVGSSSSALALDKQPVVVLAYRTAAETCIVRGSKPSTPIGCWIAQSLKVGRRGRS